MEYMKKRFRKGLLTAFVIIAIVGLILSTFLGSLLLLV